MVSTNRYRRRDALISAARADRGRMEVILNIEDYKQRLRAKEQELLEDARRAEASARDLSDPSAQDWSDASVNDEEKSGQINELDIDSTTLNRVRDALKRIEEGTYGKCVVDGGPIEEKRLQAMPWTPYCLKHEQLLEKEHPRRMPAL